LIEIKYRLGELDDDSGIVDIFDFERSRTNIVTNNSEIFPGQGGVAVESQKKISINLELADYFVSKVQEIYTIEVNNPEYCQLSSLTLRLKDNNEVFIDDLTFVSVPISNSVRIIDFNLLKLLNNTANLQLRNLKSFEFELYSIGKSSKCELRCFAFLGNL